MKRAIIYLAAVFAMALGVIGGAFALDGVDTSPAARGRIIGAGNGLQVDPLTGHVLSIQKTPPTLTSCTSGAVVAGSTDVAGQISGLGATTACTVVFAYPFVKAPFCVATDVTGAAAVQVVPTATNMAVTVTSAHNFAWYCIGQTGG